MQFFGTPKGRVVAGTVVAAAGLVDLLTGQQLILGLGLTVVGAALALRGLIEMRRPKSP
jgi:hypothetical protein